MVIKVVAKSTLFQVLTRIFTSGMGFLITIIIARNFGVLGYGDFTKITAFVGLFYLLADFGLNAFYLQEDKEDKRFSSLLLFRLILSLALFIIASILGFILPFSKTLDGDFLNPIRVGIIIFSLSIVNQAIHYSFSSLFQKYHRYNFLFYSSIVGSLITLLIVFFAVNVLKSLEVTLFGFVLGSSLTNLIGFYLIKDKIEINKIDYKFILNLIRTSFPFGLMLFFNLVYFRFDIILISIFKTTNDVGIYGFSYKFFDFLVALPLFLSNALYPFLLSWEKNNRRFFDQIKKSIFVYFILSLIVVFISWFMAPLIVIVKKDFELSILPFRILILSLPIFFLTNFFQWILIVLKQQMYLLKIYFVAAIINIILNIIFIPYYGYLASAIITGVSEGLVLLLLSFKMFSVRKNIHNQTRI